MVLKSGSNEARVALMHRKRNQQGLNERKNNKLSEMGIKESPISARVDQSKFALTRRRVVNGSSKANAAFAKGAHYSSVSFLLCSRSGRAYHQLE